MKKILLILTFLAFLACKKTETYTYSIHGNAKHKYTGNNIPGVYIAIGDANWYGSKDGFYTDTYTDVNGNYNANFEIKEKDNKTHVFVIRVMHPLGYDSTNNAFKYEWENIEKTENEIVNNQDLLLTPSGKINFFVTDDIWNTINADSILIQSPYETKYIVKNITPENKIYFMVNPSIESTFEWSYFKNGIQSLAIIKSIFVPNHWTSHYNNTNTSFNYQLSF